MSGRRPWGWHRLDPYWAERVVAGASIRPGELVVDLGAGTGALTLPLLEAGARVIAVELHAGRARQLREKVSDHAAAVVECDLEDFVPPGRPFRRGGQPALRAHRRSPGIRRATRRTSLRPIWCCSEPSYGASSTKTVEISDVSTRVAACPTAKRLYAASTGRLSRPPTEAAEAVANIPRNQHRTLPYGRRPRSRPEKGRERPWGRRRT